MPRLNVYTSTVNGVTRQTAVPGTRVDQRFARSRGWRLTHRDDGNGAIPIDPAAAARYQGRQADAVIAGEPGTMDDPDGAPARSEFDTIEDKVRDVAAQATAEPDPLPPSVPAEDEPQTQREDEGEPRTMRRPRTGNRSELE